MALSVGSLVAFLKLDTAGFDGGVRAAQRSLVLTGDSASRASASTDRFGSALTGAGRAADRSASAASKLRASQLQLLAAQERYNALLAQGDASTARLASSEASLVRAQERVRATSPFTPAAVANADKMTGRVRGLIADSVKMAAGFAVLGAVFELGAAVKSANDFQRQMLLIQTQAGASADEVQRMSKAVLALSPQVATSPEQLAVSLYHIESVGLRGAAALNVLRVAAEGAKVGNANLEETTNALTATVASGIKGAQNMAQAMGALNATVGAGDMKLSDLNEALGSGVLAVVKGYGLSLADVGAALATFGDNNIRGAEAATMLRMAVQAMSQPAREGQAELDKLGLKVDTLRKDMQTGGLDKAILDLNAHLKAAGVTGVQVGGILTETFGKRAGPGLAVLMGQIDRLQSKYADITKGANTFGSAWTATTQTASYGFDKLKASAESAGITVFQKVGPVLGQVASDIGVVLPAAVSVLEHALAPLGAALGAVGGLLKDSGGAASEVARILHDIAPIAGTVGSAVLGMWLGFKAGETVVAIFNAIRTGVTDMAGATVVGLNNMVTRFQMMTAEAEGSATEMAGVGAASKVASAEIVASGETASIGWAGLAGPIGAAAIGVGLLITMFHKSKQASQEATDSAKAYSSALGGGIDTGSASVLGAITSELSKNNVPQKISDLNAALGSSQFAGTQFVNAIAKGGPALASLRSNLEATAKAAETQLAQIDASNTVPQTDPRFDGLQKRVIAAKALLSDLNTQYNTLTAAAAKDLADTKAFSGASASIDQVSASTQVGSQTAQTYAAMMGIFVDKNGIAAVSADALAKAVNTVSTAEDTATQTGSGFLSALQTFASSAGTAADRAALIGATLKASNGDMLNYAGAVATATSANDSLVSAFQQQSATLASETAAEAKAAQQQSDAQANAQGRVTASSARLTAAEARLSAVRANRKATTAQITSAEAAVASAQASTASASRKLTDATSAAGASTTLAFKDTELAAINLKTGMIDLTAKGAAPLIQQLQSIQDAAEKAAEATYQHELATKGAKVAADDAYKVYVAQTRGSLMDEATQLGLTHDQAKKLADTYFGLADAKNIKKTVEMAGSGAVVNVLNQIGTQLSALTGVPWVPTININPKPALDSIKSVRNALGELVTYTTKSGIASQTFGKLGFNVQGRAVGGLLGPGWNLVGEQGPELINSHSGRVYTAQQSKSMLNGHGTHVENLNVQLTAPLGNEPVDRQIQRGLRAASFELGGF